MILLPKLKEIALRDRNAFIIRKLYLRLLNLFCDYRCYLVFKKPTESSLLPPHLPITNAKFEVITTPSQLEQLYHAGYDFSTLPGANNLTEGLSSGGILFAIFIDNELAHTSWLALESRNAAFDAVFQKISFPDAAFIGPCHTAEKFRGRGIYPYTLSRILQFIAQTGRKNALINTRITNAPSIKGIRKAGFTPHSKVHFLKISSRSFFWEKKI